MTDIEQIADRTAAGIALAYRSGEAGPVAVGRVPCSTGSRRRKGDNIFITVTPERAKEARRRRGRYRAGAPRRPLDGVPIGWKDLFDVAGTPTTAGSKLLRRPAGRRPETHLVAANAAEVGMVTLGKLNTDRVRLFRRRAQSALRHAAQSRTAGP